MGDVGIEPRVVFWALLHQIVCNKGWCLAYRAQGGVYVEHRVVFRWFGLSYIFIQQNLHKNDYSVLL